MNSQIDNRNKEGAVKPGSVISPQAGGKGIPFRFLFGAVLMVLLLAEAAYYYFSSLNPVESAIPAARAEPEAGAQPSTDDTGSEAKSQPAATAPMPDESLPEKASLSDQASIFSMASNPETEKSGPEDQYFQIKISSTKQANPRLALAYRAYVRGDDISAQREYQYLLQTEAHHADALLGMAALAARQGKIEEAAAWYSKVLEKDPVNLTAQAALANLLARTDPQAAEARLKKLIARHPAIPDLHAALGALYAENGRWQQAQQAYFEAYRLDAMNPQHAFNLAVALDHLGKSSLALQYYRRAQSLIEGADPVSLDKAALDLRIAQIETM